MLIKTKKGKMYITLRNNFNIREKKREEEKMT